MAIKQHQKIELQAEARTLLGSKVNSLRRDGFVPAVLYGKGIDNISLQIPLKTFIKVHKEAGESTLVYLGVDGKSYPTIIHDVTTDPVTDQILHADFHKVRLDEKIKAMVPVVFDGEAPAVKDLGGTFVRNMNELEVEAFPQDLPYEIKVDISVLKSFTDQILIKDIKLDNATFMASEDEIVAAVQEPLSEEELKKMLEGDQKGIEDVEEIKKEVLEGEEVVEGEEGATPAAEPTVEDSK